jgi:hypothetical protein
MHLTHTQEIAMHTHALRRLFRSLNLAAILATVTVGCTIEEPAGNSGGNLGSNNDGSNAGSGSNGNSGSGSDGSGRSGSDTGSDTGSGSGSGSDQGVPPMVTVAPVVSQSSSCGDGISPITLAAAQTANGCNLAAGTKSGCPAAPPAGKTMDALYSDCAIAPGQSDCTLSNTAASECPVGEAQGPFTITGGPSAGQAGYGYMFSVYRTLDAATGTITIQYDTYEVGVRADGSVAWQGPDTEGTTEVSARTCCALVAEAYYPGGTEGTKVAVDLQWF